MNWKQAFALGLCSVGAYVPNDEQWETLFDGMAETTASDNHESAYAVIQKYIPFSSGEICTLKVTVDGETAVSENNPYYVGIGNRFLYKGSAQYEDNGGNFYLHLPSVAGTLHGGKIYLYTRTPGTYTVKIERKL